MIAKFHNYDQYFFTYLHVGEAVAQMTLHYLICQVENCHLTKALAKRIDFNMS